jgi:3-keto-disaccharide hydrolase
MSRIRTGISSASVNGRPDAIDRRAALQALASVPLAVSVIGRPTQAGWTQLWNGRDLAGWDTYLGRPNKLTDIPGLAKNANGEYTEPVGVNRDPRGVFSVVQADGAPAIRISGEIYGGLITHAEYENYHLRFEVKWGDRRWPPREDAVRDSGCCYHSVGPHGASYGFWMRSFEFQIQEGDFGDFYSLAGVIVDAEAVAVTAGDPKSDLQFTPGAAAIAGTTRRVIKRVNAERPRGQWNTLDLYCFGQTSVHVVNGQAVMKLTRLRHKTDAGEVPLTKGRVQFQSEAAEVFYRALAIRPISEIPRGVLA